MTYKLHTQPLNFYVLYFQPQLFQIINEKDLINFITYFEISCFTLFFTLIMAPAVGRNARNNILATIKLSVVVAMKHFFEKSLTMK